MGEGVWGGARMVVNGGQGIRGQGAGEVAG